jgi:hypothetical protein
LPEARNILADVLGQSVYQSPIALDRAKTYLLALTQDGQFRVRRSAYRALARISKETFQAFLAGLAYAQQVDLRERAAEAIIWLGSDKISEDLYQSLDAELRSDPEPTVRKIIIESSRFERQKRFWADSYLSIVMKVDGQSNEQILLGWRYGKALAKVGDDNTLRLLRQHVASTSLPPNVRFWLEEICKDLSKEWRATTQKWPDPWVPFSGSLEVAIGSLRFSKKTLSDIKFLLWHDPASKPSEKNSWGGSALVEDNITFGFSLPDESELELEDGRKGVILHSSFTGNLLVFWGQGSFPAKT